MDGESISLAIGQGANQWTPIQMASVYATIANGGTRYRPQIVRRVTDGEGHVRREFEPEVLGEVPISRGAFDQVREGLRGAVNEPRGTAYYAMQGLPKGIEAAGKTGTAQVVKMAAEPVPEEELPEDHRDHAWFVAFVPFEKPRLVIAVLVENGGHGGSAAAPIAKKIMNAFLENEVKDAVPAMVPTPAPELPSAPSPPPAEQASVRPAAVEVGRGRD
jgi:penicillin-binding protein 2